MIDLHLYSTEANEASRSSLGDVCHDHDVVVVSTYKRAVTGMFKDVEPTWQGSLLKMNIMAGQWKAPHQDPVGLVTLDLAGINPETLDLDQLIKTLRTRHPDVIAVTGWEDRYLKTTTTEWLLGRLRSVADSVVVDVDPAANIERLAQFSDRLAVVVQDAPIRSFKAMVEGAMESQGLKVRVVEPTPSFTIPDLVRSVTEGTLWAPVTPAPVPPPRPVRYVNTLVVAAGTEQPVPADEPLTAGGAYDVLVDIGPHIIHSLLSETDGYWPEEHLPEGGLWLHAMLHLDGMQEPLSEALFLPSIGKSFVCGCQPGGDHEADHVSAEWVRFSVTTPEQPRVWSGELAIYYEVVPVHVQQLTLPVGTGMSGPGAELVSRLTRSFSDLGKLKDRTASFAVVPQSALLVNGVKFAANPFAVVADRAADAAALDIRTILYDAHFSVGEEGGEISRYKRRDEDGGTRYCKDASAFERDLRILARMGADLYLWLFGKHNKVMKSLADMVRQEAEARGRPAVLLVLDGEHGERAIPWGLVYDLPIGGDPDRYDPCPSVAEFGPGSTTERPIPPHCPYGEQHRDKNDVLCPFGFWGLSCLVEQPPSVDRDLEHVVTSRSEPPTFVVAADSSLDPKLSKEHLEGLAAGLASQLSTPPVDTEGRLADALGPDQMDLVYCYCHCGYARISDVTPASRYLQFGGHRIFPLDVSKWVRSTWPDPHWPTRHPLVVLNGCHTTDPTSGSLSSFVPVFTNNAGASGVVGTEITVEQGLSGWAMELFLRSLAEGESVGAALRGMRWTMLRHGNLMGLAYTPFCLSNLSIRSQTDRAEVR